MHNELIVIEQTNAVAVLSTDDGVKTLLDNVRENIANMDGGSMKNKASRAKIKSNAFKATQAFAKINSETIEPLISNLTAKIQPQLDVINAIKANQSVLKSGLQQIRKDFNAEVKEFEDEIQRVEDEKFFLAALEEAHVINEEFNRFRESERLIAHLDAINDNHEFDRQKAEKAELARVQAEEAEKERVEREKRIAEESAENARLKAEEDARLEKQRLETEKQAAIDAQKEAERLAEKQKQAAIQAELDAEEKRLADVEQAKIDEANRIESERLAKEKREQEAAILRAENRQHLSTVMTQTKESIMAMGLSENDAKTVTKALKDGLIANVGKIQF